jgi:hypothetical protein
MLELQTVDLEPRTIRGTSGSTSNTRSTILSADLESKDNVIISIVMGTVRMRWYSIKV